jgi:outer membrane protein OmpA-like peptidoglycan-associated protein
MSTMMNLECTCCEGPVEHLRYFPRQLLTADDMRSEQAYVREKLRRHNRYLHGWGVVCGCIVEPVANAKGWQVRVCPGYAVSIQGDEISIDECITVDLKTGAHEQPCSVRWPCPPVGEMPGGRGVNVTAYVAVRYAECFSRPVRVHPAGCGCDETGCEYSRVRDSFELKVLWTLPKSHTREPIQSTGGVPPCPSCADDPWVILATITLPKDESTSIDDSMINYRDRRSLLPTSTGESAIIFDPVLFVPTQDTIGPESVKILNRLVAFMKEHQDAEVSLSGYTDNEGNELANIGLSGRRWTAVKQYLVTKGIEDSRISGQAFGESNPIADNNTAEGRLKNNRVEIKII